MSEVTGKLTVNEPLCVATTGFKPGLKSKIRINCLEHNYTVFVFLSTEYIIGYRSILRCHVLVGAGQARIYVWRAHLHSTSSMGSDQNSNPQHHYCKARTLTTAPSCYPSEAISIKFIGLNSFWLAFLDFVLARAEVFQFLILCFFSVG